MYGRCVYRSYLMSVIYNKRPAAPASSLPPFCERPSPVLRIFLQNSQPSKHRLLSRHRGHEGRGVRFGWNANSGSDTVAVSSFVFDVDRCHQNPAILGNVCCCVPLIANKVSPKQGETVRQQGRISETKNPHRWWLAVPKNLLSDNETKQVQDIRIY